MKSSPVLDDRTLYDEIVRRIVAVADPDRIILFGSRARGDHRPNSDVDVLVIQETREPRYQRSRRLYGALSDILVPMEIVVYTPAEVKEWRDTPQAFITTALREGRVLHERKGSRHPRLDPEGRGRHRRAQPAA